MEKGMISVDKWSEGSQAYFLTHLHSDHTKGLSPNWSKGPLFCSSLTTKLFPAKFPGFNTSLIRVLEIGTSYSLSLYSPSTASEVKFEVTAIDADHCPGAVMYLFRGEFCCMLYTGDFRWEGISERALIGKSMLLNALGSDKIDTLYLDNTYCNPQYFFPPREVVAHQVVDIITSHPGHDIVIGINTLGKEDLLLHISRALKIKIWVWPERLQIMHLLGFHDNFTTDTCLTRVRAVPFYSFSINTLEELNLLHPTIGIMPSGLPWVVRRSDEIDHSAGSSRLVLHNSSEGTNPSPHDLRSKPTEELGGIRKFHRYIYSVPYSDHSCFDELKEFLKFIRPLRVEGIVSKSSCCIDPVHYLGHLSGQEQVSEQSPKKLQRRKVKPAVTCKKSIDLSIKRNLYTKFGRVRTSRVSVLRRRSRGAKIVDTINID